MHYRRRRGTGENVADEVFARREEVDVSPVVRADARSGHRLAQALQRVGKKPSDLYDLLGTSLDGTHAYLVGSLAAGFGSTSSDIDIHVFDADNEQPSAPILFFLDRTGVDVVHFLPGEVAEAVGALPAAWTDLGGGVCAFGPTPARRLQVRLGRWSSAIPLLDTSPALVAPDHATPIAACNARGALRDTICIATVAALAEAAKRASGTVGGAWRRSATSLVDLIATARGQVFVGSKWVWQKARSAGLDDRDLAAIESVRTRRGFTEASSRFGLPEQPLEELVILRPGEAQPVEISSRAMLLVDHARLVDASAAVHGPLHELVDQHGPDLVLGALASRAVVAEVDDSALDRHLR